MQGRVILAAGLLLLVASCAPGGPSPPATERPSGVPQADFARAVALQRQGEHARSVPFFRSAAEGEPDVSGLHAELAKALHNATLQMGFSGHGVRFAVARSQDRARMRNEALAEIQRAIDLEFHLDGARASWRWTPVPVWTELTLPPDRVVDAVPDGVRRKDAYRLLVPPGRGQVEVTCRAE